MSGQNKETMKDWQSMVHVKWEHKCHKNTAEYDISGRDEKLIPGGNVKTERASRGNHNLF